jgi:hypothetical protein
MNLPSSATISPTVAPSNSSPNWPYVQPHMIVSRTTRIHVPASPSSSPPSPTSNWVGPKSLTTSGPTEFSDEKVPMHAVTRCRDAHADRVLVPFRNRLRTCPEGYHTAYMRQIAGSTLPSVCPAVSPLVWCQKPKALLRARA